MADAPGLGFWGTIWQGLEGGTGKTFVAPVKVGAQLGYWGILWRDRGEGYDGKTPEDAPEGFPFDANVVRVHRQQGTKTSIQGA